MRKISNLLSNETGGVLIIVSVMLLALLTIIGISATKTSVMESKITVNDHLYKMAFYEADGGTQVGIQLLEECISCPGGFQSEPADINGNIRVTKSDFYTNPILNSTLMVVSNSERDAVYPLAAAGDPGIPHTNLKYFGETRFAIGSAIHMASGYEGRGKGAAGGGGEMFFKINAQRTGIRNSKACVTVQWRHVIGQEGVCKYGGNVVTEPPPG